MTTIPINARGGPCDVAFHGGYLYLTYQSGEGADAFVVVEVYAPTGGEKVIGAQWRCSSGAFPRLYAALGSWWLAYRDEQERITLRKDGEVVWQSPTQAGGNDPVCFGRDTDRRPAFAWLTFNTNVVYVAPLTKPSDQTPEGSAFGTGLSHIDGNVVTVDEARGSVPGMTRPAWAGSVVVGEHPDSGVLVRHLDGRERVFWTGYVTYTPRVAVDGLTYALATWNGSYGPMLLTFTAEDLTVSVSGCPPGDGWTLRTDIAEIDIVEYLLGSEWSRNGMHVPASVVTYSHPFQARSGLNWVQHTKFDPPDTRGATWTYTDQWVGLAFDGTNELDKGYRIVVPGTDQTAALYPRRMKVGKQHAHTVDVELHYLATNTRRPVTYSGWVEAVYDGPRIGDIPPTTHAVIMFDPAATDTRGWREQNIGARGLGCWYWHRARKADNSVADMRWIGTTNAPRVPDIPVTYTSALPVLPAPEPEPPPKPKPEPEPTPMPTLKNRDQWFAEFSEINDFYAAPEGLQRPGGMVIDGAADIIAMREWGFNLMSGATVADTKARIRQSEEWRAKHPEGEPQEPPPVTPPPTSTRSGPLVVSGRIYRDNGGNRLPFYIHAGDLISRFSRDESGSLRMLDEIVTLRADGGRFWSWLIGDPYWTGRKFRGDWSVLQRFVAACKARNLRLVLSQGDLWQAGETTARQWLSDLAGFIRTEGAEWFDFVDGGNELWQNPHGTSPESVASAMRPLAGIGPILSLSDFLQDQDWPGNSDDERKEAMLREAARWKQSPARVQDGHPAHNTGDGCVRRTWNFAYELNTDAWINSEPRGYSRNVTVYNRVDRSVQLMTAAATWMTGGAYVAMSSPGVISDGMRDGYFDAGESFLDMPGFHDLDALRRWLPQNVGGWRRVHGGWANSPRVFAVDNRDTRCDHAIDEATGEYVAILYAGPYHQVREATVEDFDPNLGGGRRIVKGRIR